MGMALSHGKTGQRCEQAASNEVQIWHHDQAVPMVLYFDIDILWNNPGLFHFHSADDEGFRQYREQEVPDIFQL
jgi:hypothetical protein